MGDDLKKLCINASCLKAIILQNKNLDVLLYLAKYNPDVCISDLVEKFGTGIVDSLKDLEKYNLLTERNGQLTLTEEGIFQVDGLLAIAV
ncbi:MAG: hypothetical protein KAI53_00905 [Candidatus Aenigmarchaeota archaeon]|nr:hypothetical protein [Candidatus Aenigmarchaeota archaeon]